ncbi:MAG: CBS domain-containing protein [Alkalimonas sp.]|nr:CBS domain-containing protein [Alkalimonas sp.]
MDSVRLVKDIMVKEVVTVSPFTTLREALSLMKKHDLKSLVVDKQQPHDAYGLITHTNILKTIVAESGDIDLLHVYDIYTKPVVAVGEDLAVKHVAALMSQQRIKRVLVLNNNELAGLVTMQDIMDPILEMVE